ncbi:hypothetical protein H9P43_003167 [Blastocladiella emersonii ATCC 22665]|nr:hypothetical protein H9P43_003167 [Blastocladiella emersonii ATCC 22665]
MMNLAGVHLGDEVSLRGIRDIVFPEHNDHVPHIAIDIGGSLAKVAYFTRHSTSSPGSSAASSAESSGTASSLAAASLVDAAAAAAAVAAGGRGSPIAHGISGGRLNFVKFETAKIAECVAFLRRLYEDQDAAALLVVSSRSPSPPPPQPAASSSGGEPPRERGARSPARILLATGGGAHKFCDLLERELGVTIYKYDEMECLVKGLNFLVKYVPREVFSYRENEPIQFETTPPAEAYPYMLVNIGSGVSILKVTGPGEMERVSGTSLGGGTYWGLMSMIATGQGRAALTFEDMLELSKDGDNTNVDMLVGDIYGMDYGKIGLKSTTIASTFGKVFKKTPDERASTRINDVSRSLLYMVSNNIGQIAYLNARAHGIPRIYFGGYFICGHPITMHTLSYAIHFWSRGETKALFLRHEGFLGAVGAFLQHQ